MKRFVFIICCWTLALVTINAQSLEQKKICALKWTLQQTFYNKPEGQQIARLNVCDFKSFSDFQKNKLISDAIKKVSNPADLSRVKSIIDDKTDANLQSYVPAGAKKEYKADLEKIKSMAPATNEEEEEENNVEEEVVEESTEAPAPEIQPVEEQNTETASEDATTDQPQPEESATAADGVSFLEVVLIALGLYAILTACLFLFLRSKKNAQKNEELVTMEQYRAERVRLMERIKAVEIEMENLKSLKHDAPAEKHPIVTASPIEEVETQPQPVVVTPKPQEAEPQSLFPETSAETTAVVEEQPAVVRPKFSAVMFYPVPVDGMFVNGTSDIGVGKSLYMLKTNDDQNATFQILNTPEAIAMALVSMSETVKPACKVLNTVAAPVEILAEKLGTAEREGDGWRIINKAVVRLI